MVNRSLMLQWEVVSGLINELVEWVSVWECQHPYHGPVADF